MVNVTTDIYDKSVNRSAMVRLYEKRVVSKVDLLLSEHKARVVKLIEGGRLDRKGAALLNKSIEREIKNSFKQIYGTASRSLLDLVADQTSYMYQSIESATSKIWRAKKPPLRVSEDIVLKKPLYKNKTLLKGWEGVSTGERKRISAVIRRGISKGWTEAELAKEVRRGSVFKITRNQSRTLVTTAITSVKAQTDHAVYEANENLMRGWQYVSVLDSRTTSVCVHRDGKVYPISETEMLPPAHYGCRSVTIPVVKSYDDLAKMEGVAQIRKRNLKDLTAKEISYYDGQTPLKETYDGWLRRQPVNVQLRHLGDSSRLALFRSGQLTIDKFTNSSGKSVGIKELRRITDSGYDVPGQTRRFAMAKQHLDSLKLTANYPDELVHDKALRKSLREYYLLQAGELDGQLSLTNYRGTLMSSKRSTKTRVLSSPPTEENLKFNPITGRYEDARLYQPHPGVLENSYKLIDESILPDGDKLFIKGIVGDLRDKMGVNERAAVAENLRIVLTRARKDGKPWANLKAVLNAQMKFDVMNVSDYMETQLRKNSKLLHRLKQDNYIDPVLGEVQLQDLHDNFIKNIFAKNKWEDTVAPKIAKQLRGILDLKIPLKVRNRLDNEQLQEFYLRFANRLALADSPDRDQLAVTLGRDLYNMANYRGSRDQWYKLGLKLLDEADSKGIFKLETFGVQKRRMKSRLGSHYFGPYYDTFAVNLRIVDPRIQEYARLTRQVDVGLRVAVTNPKNRLIIRPGYKTYFVDRGLLGYKDTRIPITSTNSFSGFPTELVDKNLSTALNWAADSKYKIDEDFHDFIKKLINFEDDRGRAKYFHDLNEYRSYIIERGDAYERFKAMDWLRDGNKAFSNHSFVDHRARIYERGLIGPQSGETFRPFLNSAESKLFSKDGFHDFEDQIGAFLGGLSDKLEGKHNSLTVLGRKAIAHEWRDEMVKIGQHMLRGKPSDVRAVLQSKFMAQIEGEEQGKALRYAIELAKISDHLDGNFSSVNLEKLNKYKISVALEQDASSSGAQIIALTTKNKQLAEMSNVVATNQKRRLYDEIAAATFNDPRFRELNLKLGLTEKDLRKAAKAQNMVTFYGAGDKTGILNVENKLAKVLGRDTNVLVVKAAERDAVLNEISARMAKYTDLDPVMHDELKALRKDIKDIFDRGEVPGDDIMRQLFFLDPKTKDFVEKMTRNYGKVITPKDFQTIANIMSENLATQVPILKDFTKFFGRLAEDFVTYADPQKSSKSLAAFLEMQANGVRKKRPPEFLERFKFWDPNGSLSKLIYGVPDNKLPKSWTNIPWVNFDGKTIEQNFTQVFEQRLSYKDKEGKWITNILQVPQKTDPSFWDEVRNKTGTINDIVDAQKARTAFAVNGNHSNDAVIVKRFHLWGQKNGVQTSTIHDAFFTNAADVVKAKEGIRKTYSEMAKTNTIKATLDEMRRRGLPKNLYDSYLNEAIETGLIPVVGRSRVGGRLLTDSDILTPEEILDKVPTDYKSNRSWYGIGQ
jgi:SPP1 gp7 family putative phage head morphogenesis protein